MRSVTVESIWVRMSSPVLTVAVWSASSLAVISVVMLSVAKSILESRKVSVSSRLLVRFSYMESNWLLVSSVEQSKLLLKVVMVVS